MLMPPADAAVKILMKVNVKYLRQQTSTSSTPPESSHCGHVTGAKRRDLIGASSTISSEVIAYSEPPNFPKNVEVLVMATLL